MLDTVLSRTELEETLGGMCGGSLYAYSDTINKGYLSLPDGVRVGVGGRASCRGREVIGVCEISALVIRIPHKTRTVGAQVCRLLREFKREKGVLVYSPPGVGKTTLLRGVAKILSSGNEPLRTVVIDTRGELSFAADSENMCLDILSGYPKALGIEIATRSLSAEVMICDEIGDLEEAMALVSSHNCGVPLIASAHAGNIDELLRRTSIRLLHEAEIFGAYVGITRADGGEFNYDVHFKDDCKVII
jgi:stage III sporulation protein AA